MSKKQNTKAELPQGTNKLDGQTVTGYRDTGTGIAFQTKPQAQSMDEHDPLLAAYNDGDGNQTGQPQAEHSPLPAKWHDCEVAEKQIKLLQQQANHAQALAEALRIWLDDSDTDPYEASRKALAAYEESK